MLNHRDNLDRTVERGYAGLHYGPGPWVDTGRQDWTAVYYHKADSAGIGFNRTSTGSNAVGQYFTQVRDVYGDNIHLLHDVHYRCTPIEAARLAKELEPYHLFWLEDPVAGELQEGLRLIRQHSTAPIAIGEVFNSIYDYSTLMTEQQLTSILLLIILEFRSICRIRRLLMRCLR